jgi:ankyrin repeat protein
MGCETNTNFVLTPPDASAVDNKSNSVFHLASTTKVPNEKIEQGSLVKLEPQGRRLIHALRASGVNAHSLNTAGDTPLHTMKYRQFSSDVFGALVDAGLNTEARDQEGRSPLFKAISEAHDKHECRELFDTMVRSGCSIDTLDDRGRNLLFLVLTGDRSDLFPHLLELGLSPKHVDLDGNTL